MDFIPQTSMDKSSNFMNPDLFKLCSEHTRGRQLDPGSPLLHCHLSHPSAGSVLSILTVVYVEIV